MFWKELVLSVEERRFIIVVEGSLLRQVTVLLSKARLTVI